MKTYKWKKKSASIIEPRKQLVKRTQALGAKLHPNKSPGPLAAGRRTDCDMPARTPAQGGPLTRGHYWHNSRNLLSMHFAKREWMSHEEVTWASTWQATFWVRTSESKTRPYLPPLPCNPPLAQRSPLAHRSEKCAYLRNGGLAGFCLRGGGWGLWVPCTSAMARGSPPDADRTSIQGAVRPRSRAHQGGGGGEREPPSKETCVQGAVLTRAGEVVRANTKT